MGNKTWYTKTEGNGRDGNCQTLYTEHSTQSDLFLFHNMSVISVALSFIHSYQFVHIELHGRFAQCLWTLLWINFEYAFTIHNDIHAIKRIHRNCCSNTVMLQREFNDLEKRAFTWLIIIASCCTQYRKQSLETNLNESLTVTTLLIDELINFIDKRKRV